MANLLAQLLQGSTYASTRPDVMVMDTTSTSLPANSGTPMTVDGVVLSIDDRVLYTALTTGNNTVCHMHVDHTTGTAVYSMVPALDGRNTGHPGGPTKFDVLLVEAGTSANKLMCYDGSTWTDLSTL